jgi:polyisoprenoid-binding protein YceI
VGVSRDERGLSVEHVDISIPVRSLATGMKVRDEHMRKYIFTDSNSQTPDLRFIAEAIACSTNSSAQEFPCRVSGMLTIRGTARPFDLNLRVRTQSGATADFHAAGDSIVKLSDYGINPPSQLGVKASNDVKVRAYSSTQHIDSVRRRRDPMKAAFAVLLISAGAREAVALPTK